MHRRRCVQAKGRNPLSRILYCLPAPTGRIDVRRVVAFTDIAERKIKDGALLHLNQLKDSRFVIEIPCRPTCIRG